MTIPYGIASSPAFVNQFALLALRAVVLGGVAGVGLAAFRVKSASLRLSAWTTVLYAALAMPLLSWILPPLSTPIPALTQNRGLQNQHAKAAVSDHVDSAPAAGITTRMTNRNTLSGHRAAPVSSTERRALSATSNLVEEPNTRPAGQKFSSLSISWSAVATWTYLGSALILLSRFAIGLLLAGRLRRSARRIEEARARSMVDANARGFGLTLMPEIAQSEAVSVPMTVGVLRPAILLPMDWREWENAKLDAVIAHEVSHVARRDALTQRVALIHRAVFWFSPFAWWLDHHLSELAEQASDEAVLSRGADQTDYARTLLGFFEALHAAPGRVWWQGVAMAKSGQAERRVEKILAWRGDFGMKKSMAVVIVTLLLPVVYLAAAVGAAQQVPRAPQSAPPAATPQPAPAPSVAPVPAVVVRPALAPGSEPDPAGAPAPESEPDPTAAPAIAPVAPMAPASPGAPTAPVTAWAGQRVSSSGDGYSYAYGYDDEERFVIVGSKTDVLTMSGSSEDARHAQALKKKIAGDFIWFERDEKSYIIRDQATIDRARKLWTPQEELGKKQEALGKQQEALGKQQEALGKRMEEVRVKVPDMTAELDKLRAELKQLSAGATVEQVGKLQSEIGDLQSKVGEIQSHAGDEQSKLGEEMGALGEKQGKLGQQQGEIGRQQGELAEKASREMKELLDEAIKNGKAQPEPESGGGASL